MAAGNQAIVTKSGDLTLAASHVGTQIGFAPDGFEIHFDPFIATSFWALKKGTRPSAPGGAYGGLFEKDFEYIASSGTLDECNGRMVDGTYA